MLKRNFLIKSLCAYALTVGIVLGLASTCIHAETGSMEGVIYNVGSQAAKLSETPKGIANFGRGKASITIIGNKGQNLIGKKFRVYKLFDAENSQKGESINYTMNPDFAPALKKIVGSALKKSPSAVTEYEVIDYIHSLSSNKIEGATAKLPLEGRYSKLRYFIEQLRSEITNMKIVKNDLVTVTQTKNGNQVEIAGLEYGYYITDEVTSVSGSHSAASLCMVNTANPSATVQIKSDYPSIIKKIQEDDSRDSIGNNGWNDIGDFEIGQTVPYKFTSNVPNINGYDKYYFAWHDKMNEALTLHKDSIIIKISNGSKTYVLKTSEFTLNLNPGKNETFKVEIPDLKFIVDREFNKKNSLNENVYGQTIELTYDATLNDKAIVKTGRPGFENDVKLEFSNDADTEGKGTTGETPWDTVVCFTYRLDAVKVNEHSAKLEGAKFRLYSDKNCTNEVLVKKVSGGYAVINRDSIGGKDHTGGKTPSNAVEMISDTNGGFNIIGLDQGSYFLKETKAPVGYRAIIDPIELKVIPTFCKDRNSYIKGDGATDKTLIKLDATAHIKHFWDGVFKDNTSALKTNVQNGSMNLTVINKVGQQLPVAGSSITIILMALGVIIMGGTVYYSKKKGKKARA